MDFLSTSSSTSTTPPTDENNTTQEIVTCKSNGDFHFHWLETATLTRPLELWEISYKQRQMCFDAAEVNNQALLRELIEQQKIDWDEGLKGACKGGHTELVKYMISKGARVTIDILLQACESSHSNLVTFFASLLNDNYFSNTCESISLKDFEIILRLACGSGHLSMIELAIQHGAKNFRDGMRCALLHHNVESVKLMKKYGGDDLGFLNVQKIMGEIICRVLEGVLCKDILSMMSSYIRLPGSYLWTLNR